jgi:hypothetical protein
MMPKYSETSVGIFRDNFVFDRDSGKPLKIQDPFLDLEVSASCLSFRATWHQLPPSKTVMLLKCLLILQSLPETVLEEAAKKLEELGLPYFATNNITKQQAQAVANLFISDHLPDRFTADQPCLTQTRNSWNIPIILTYPYIGSLGQVGTVTVSTASELILSHTPIEEMKQTGQKLYELHRDAIEARFL